MEKKIACIGWGSLIWDPGNLLIKNQWFQDGPLLPIEFKRQSASNRLTLVICKNAKPVKTLWALMNTSNLDEAKESLRYREKTSIGNIGFIEKTDIEKTDEINDNDDVKETIKKWLDNLNLDAAIWTNLPPEFNKKKVEISEDEAVEYLKTLNNSEKAEEYVRKAPKQVDTAYRQRFEKEFGWTPIP